MTSQRATRVAVVFPLFYSLGGLHRLKTYIDRNTDRHLVELFVLNSNPDLHLEGHVLCRSLGYSYSMRSNCGGGEGALWHFQRVCLEEGRLFDAVVYLEESCEPLVDNWVWKLVSQLTEDTWVTGWDWNFRGKNRGFGIPVQIGRGWRKAWAYVHPEAPTPLDEVTASPVWDCPGYRHEVLAIRFDVFRDRYIQDPRGLPWSSLAPGVYGRAMERMYWLPPTKNLPSNIQFDCLMKGSAIPSPLNRNLGYFREVDQAQLMNPLPLTRQFTGKDRLRYSALVLMRRARALMKFAALHAGLGRMSSATASRL